jgi:hypothetical protein
MKKYSPYIEKYIKEINRAGYTISDNGNQLSKHIGCYEIIITDLTVRSFFTKIKTVLIWIKNKETRTIEIEKLYKHELLPLSFHKIESFTEKVVAELSANYKPIRENQPQEAVRNIDIDIDITIPSLKVREVSAHDVTI